jgi:hypothetical protein
MNRTRRHHRLRQHTCVNTKIALAYTEVAFAAEVHDYPSLEFVTRYADQKRVALSPSNVPLASDGDSPPRSPWPFSTAWLDQRRGG